jgi:MFS transporter, PAT family, beta-lactamase induction signal transducer AmpG
MDMIQPDVINTGIQQQSFTKPHYIFFIVLASGISQGFVSVTLPYLLSQNGFSVGTIADIVALGVSANLWRFLWGPLVDLSLSLRKWFWISTLLCIGTLMLLCVTPFTVKGTALLYSIVFVSQVAATFMLLPVSGFMAKRIETNKKGKAGGWFQAGTLGGTGLGGGVGLWLATHYNVTIAGIVLCAISLLFSLVVVKIKDVPHTKNKTIATELKVMGKDIITMIKTPVILFIIFMICLPIGTGAVSNLWSAIAVDWKTGADTVALVTGILFGLVSAAGCVAGGFIADRWGNWKSYLGFGIFYAFITGSMALFPYTPLVYITGVIIYAFSIGMMNAAFTSVLLFATGKKNAATKFSLLVSLGNLSFVYMTSVDGWVHDKHSSKYMLLTEAALCLLSVLICVIILNWMKARKMIVKTID